MGPTGHLHEISDDLRQGLGCAGTVEEMPVKSETPTEKPTKPQLPQHTSGGIDRNPCPETSKHSHPVPLRAEPDSIKAGPDTAQAPAPAPGHVERVRPPGVSLQASTTPPASPRVGLTESPPMRHAPPGVSETDADGHFQADPGKAIDVGPEFPQGRLVAHGSAPRGVARGARRDACGFARASLSSSGRSCKSRRGQRGPREPL